jgi:ribonuclease Z
MLDFINKHKKTLIIVSAVLILLIVGGIWFLNNLPDFAVEWLINKGVTTNQIENYFDDDALYVITTGTGAPLPDLKRVGPQAVIVAGDQVLVFDAGPGSTRRIEMIMDASSVDALFLTHYHSDHIGDLGELMLKRWATGGSVELLPNHKSRTV